MDDDKLLFLTDWSDNYLMTALGNRCAKFINAHPAPNMKVMVSAYKMWKSKSANVEVTEERLDWCIEYIIRNNRRGLRQLHWPYCYEHNELMQKVMQACFKRLDGM